jgi:hypothetical protein
VNSSKDDFGFLINNETQLGFVTSNREGGQGGDDIYKFKEIKKLECEQFLNGTIIDKETGAVLVNAKVTLSDGNYKVLKEVTTDKDG